MKNKRRIILLLLTCCLAQPVFGQVSFGDHDCGQWMKRTDSGALRVAREAWLTGYLSGLNWMHVANEPKEKISGPLSKVNSLDQMTLWMDNYCTKNPLSSASTGAVKLFLELMNK
jgi:hypothetical protein